MTAALVILSLLVAALVVALIISNRQILASHDALVRAVMAKNGTELALMNRAERRPVKPAEEPTLEWGNTRDEMEARIAAEMARVEGDLKNGVPVGFDGN